MVEPEEPPEPRCGPLLLRRGAPPALIQDAANKGPSPSVGPQQNLQVPGEATRLRRRETPQTTGHKGGSLFSGCARDVHLKRPFILHNFTDE